MKFLLLNQTFYPDVVSTAQHLADLAVGLVERGHEVTVVATGLNRGALRQSVRREEAAAVQRPRIVARTGTDDLPVDYLQASRQPSRPATDPQPSKKTPMAEPQIDYLDIPAFLRKQAD